MQKDIEPFYTNELGTKFWIDETSTKYAKNIGLKGVICYELHTLNGEKTRMIVQNNEPYYSNPSLEQIDVALDMLHLHTKSE